MITKARKLASRILDLAMPPRCPATQEELRGRDALAAAVWGAVHFIEAPLCSRCGAPFSSEYGETIECPACIADPPDFDAARAAIVYDDASHRMIVGFKHSDRTDMTALFAKWMTNAGRGFITRDSLITPTPLHSWRLLSRRYNQSVLLARAVARQAGAGLSVDAFIRKRATPPQKELSRDGRKRNVAGAFGFRSDAARVRFSGAHVILIDDVLTTGATLSAAARALKRAGASRVDALVLARVVKGGIGAI